MPESPNKKRIMVRCKYHGMKRIQKQEGERGECFVQIVERKWKIM